MNHSPKQPQSKKNPKMQRFYWLGGILFIVGIIGFMIVQSQQDNFVPSVKGAPRIQVLNTTVDHGDVVVNKMVTSSFEIRNVGDENLYFRDQPYVEVIQGCCPPQVQLSKEVVKPGETARVEMTYSMHEGMDGPHELRIHVNTNDPTEPETLLTAYSNWVR